MTSYKIRPKNIPTPATAADIKSGNYTVLDTTDVLKKLDFGTLLQATAQNALGNIKNLPTTATEVDLNNGNYIVVDTPEGPKKLPGDAITPRSMLSNFVKQDLTDKIKFSESYVSNSVGNAPELYQSSGDSDAFIKIDNIPNGSTVTVSGKAGATRCWSKIKNGLVVEIIDNTTIEKTLTVIKDNTWDSLYLSFIDAVNTPPTASVSYQSVDDAIRTIGQPMIDSALTSDESNIIEIGKGYVVNSVGVAPEAVSVDTTQGVVIIDNVPDGVVVYISGKAGSTRCWSKIKNGLVAEIINNDNSNYVTLSVTKDNTWDALYLNFREIIANVPSVKIKFEGVNLCRYLEQYTQDKVGTPFSYDLSEDIVKGDTYTTTVGNDIAMYGLTSNNGVAAIVKKNLAVGASISVYGLAGSTRCWATLNGDKVVRIINNDSESAQTMSFTLGDGEDGFVCSFRNVNLYEPTCYVSFPDPFTAIKNIPRKDKDVKVLLVGSSFGVNTVVQFPALAKAAGINIVCVNMYRGSGTFADLKDSIANNTSYGTAAKWDYRSAREGWVETDINKLIDALNFEPYDYIILQRAAPGKTGGSDTWTTSMADDLEYILNYIRANCKGCPKILFNSVFGRPVNSTSIGGSRATQQTQALQIMTTAEQMKAQFGIDVIPASIAIQNARETSLSYAVTSNSSHYTVPDLSGEGDHLDTGVGSYILGCLLFDFIFKSSGKSCLELGYLPDLDDVHNNPCFSDAYFTQITEQEAMIARYCAKAAIDNPSAINTEIASRYPYPNS